MTGMTRRNFLRAGAVSIGFLMGTKLSHTEEELRSIEDAVDHILLGVPDLDFGMKWIETKTGVKAAIGGVHPGRGTRNALLSLGDRHYLEIIAPDPAQKEYRSDFSLHSLNEPTLITWAASVPNLHAFVKKAQRDGFAIVGPTPGSRKRTDGSMLRWKTAVVNADFSQGAVDPFPFFIQWETDSAHPSQDSPKGCKLRSLVLEHPDADGLKDALMTLGIRAEVRPAKRAKLTATLSTPKGIVTFS